jgi:hypothetical protein
MELDQRMPSGFDMGLYTQQNVGHFGQLSSQYYGEISHNPFDEDLDRQYGKKVQQLLVKLVSLADSNTDSTHCPLHREQSYFRQSEAI